MNSRQTIRLSDRSAWHRSNYFSLAKPFEHWIDKIMVARLFKWFLPIVLLASLSSGGIKAQDDFGFGQNQETQEEFKPDEQSGFGSQEGGFSNSFGPPGGANQPAAEFTAKFHLQKGTGNGILSITGVPDAASHSHLYSQKKLKNQIPTEFKIVTEGIERTGELVPDVDPVEMSRPQGNEIWVTEEFSGPVTWSAPITFLDPTTAESAEVKIQIEGQVCNVEGCIPFEGRTVTAKLAGFITSGPFRVTNKRLSTKVEWTGKATPATVEAGGTIKVELTATSDQDWHIYSMTKPVDKTAYNPTLIVFSKTNDWITKPPVASAEPIAKKLGTKNQLYHEGTVTFTAEIKVPDDAKEGTSTLSGKIGYQTCDSKGICLQLTAADFSFPITVGEDSSTDSVEVTFAESSTGYDAIQALSLQRAATMKKLTASDIQPFDLQTFLGYAVLAFFAGLILNVMPCVLPVIGLKMMSFVEQSGEDRGRIFALNMSFSLGLMTVFWGLATLVIFFGFGWGDLLNKELAGVIIASGVVFAFGLSLIGVWEIPIPGFASSSSASKLAEKEGLGGAFIKGILTTILATPCVGPMLIPAMTFAMTQTQIVGFLLFTILGFGMAFPFVMVAFFPSAIKLLPKPGAWMETFKQLMGFILIGAVIFLLNTFSQEGEQVAYLMAVMTMLFSISVGCWWIGRTSIAAETKQKIAAYAVGILIIVSGTVFGFRYLTPSEYHLEWQPYSNSHLASIRAEGKPVFIDFTGPG